MLALSLTFGTAGAQAESAAPADATSGTLAEAVTLAGVVRTPGGKPAAGAEVILCDEPGADYAFTGTATEPPELRPEQQARAKIATTRASGRFSLKTRAKYFTLLVRHTSGVMLQSEDQFKNDTSVTLAAWSRIQGVVMEGAQPRPGSPVRVLCGWRATQPRTGVDAAAQPRVSVEYAATADAQGRFEIARALPGPATLLSGTDPGNPGPRLNVALKPGEKNQVQLGGLGRPVRGRITLEPGSPAAANWSDGFGFLVDWRPNPPQDVARRGQAAYERWLQDWEKTPEGMAQARIRDTILTVTLRRDGTFLIPDVPAGKYTLRVGVFEPLGAGPAKEQPGRRPLAQATRQVIVPEAPGGRSDNPVEIADIPLPIPSPAPAAGAAPDFSARTLDGREVALKDFRGKYVLLYFWATWSGPCRQELLNIKKAGEEFGKNPRFAMLGLSLDDTPAAPLDFVKKSDMNGIQAHLGPWKTGETVTEQYGVDSIPATFLIDPEGKLMTMDLRGEHLHEALARVLGK